MSLTYIVLLKEIEYGVYEDLIIIYPKPYHLKGDYNQFQDQLSILNSLNPQTWHETVDTTLVLHPKPWLRNLSRSGAKVRYCKRGICESISRPQTLPEPRTSRFPMFYKSKVMKQDAGQGSGLGSAGHKNLNPP